MGDVSIPQAIGAARANHKACRQKIRHLQLEYLRDVVHDALSMLGFAGTDESANEAAYYVLSVDGGKAEDWIRRYMRTHEPTGPARIRRVEVADYDPDLDPGAGGRPMPSLSRLDAIVERLRREGAPGRGEGESSQPET